MTTTLYFCGALGEAGPVLSCPDSAMLRGAVHTLQADQVNPCTKASLTAAGVDSDGDVGLDAVHGGAFANAFTYEQATGPTGGGNENLVLRVSVAGDDIQVLFATDGAGASITPIGTAVRDLINADPDASAKVVAACPGTGASEVAALAQTNLAGGLDDGDHIKFDGNPPVCRRVNSRVTV